MKKYPEYESGNHDKRYNMSKLLRLSIKLRKKRKRK